MKEPRLLEASEIECRVGTINEKGFSLLLYKDARVDIQLLTETYGIMGWQREHKEIKGNLYCGISVWDDEKKQWITRWDCGVESNTEKEKGESSDSFKRAAFNFLCGIELYSAPFIWINGNVTSKNGKYVPSIKDIEVKTITYDKNRNISGLLIVSGDTILFNYNIDLKTYKTSQQKENAKTEQVVKEAPKTPQKAQQKAEQPKPEEKKEEPQKSTPNLSDAKKCRTPKGALLDKLTTEQLEVITGSNKYDNYVRACALILIKDRNFFVEEDDGNLDF